MLIWEEARAEARKLRERFGLRPVDIDLIEVADKLDLVVTFKKLAGGYSGLIIKEDGREGHIFINRTDSQERQRFTLAHEIGHYVERNLRGDDEFSFADEGRKRERDGEYDLHEFFADEFAGELLMPEAEFKNLLTEGKKPSDVAEYFGVSIPAVKKRAQRIKSAEKQVAANK
jgi:Predicted Zn peptidase